LFAVKGAGRSSDGKQTASSGSLINAFQYTARESDPETSLYYYRARYYDPNAGRFLNEDPPGFLSGGINFYEYVENSPLGFTDPNGFQAQPASTCCDPQKTKDIQKQLQDAFSGSSAANSKVFQKYKPCLQKMAGDITFQCGPPPPGKPTECGHTVTPGVVFLTPNGIAGKGGCKAAKSTVAHEMVHSCYNRDFAGPNVSSIDQEKEAFGIECQLFGLDAVTHSSRSLYIPDWSRGFCAQRCVEIRNARSNPTFPRS
jgi:RHS repeat-associated protein